VLDSESRLPIFAEFCGLWPGLSYWGCGVYLVPELAPDLSFEWLVEPIFAAWAYFIRVFE
jgi:hypothetical protein